MDMIVVGIVVMIHEESVWSKKIRNQWPEMAAAASTAAVIALKIVFHRSLVGKWAERGGELQNPSSPNLLRTGGSLSLGLIQLGTGSTKG